METESGERPNVQVRGPLREWRKLPSHRVGQLEVQGLWQPVYRTKHQICDKKS